jgi:4-hydroxythreonine-4-phosphate dehydrogenase
MGENQSLTGPVHLPSIIRNYGLRTHYPVNLDSLKAPKMSLPTLALFTGDPAGIGPELVEKMLQNATWRQQARVILIGQKDTISVPQDVRWHDWLPSPNV